MESEAGMMGHPIHPIRIPFPLGLLTTSVVFDIVHLPELALRAHVRGKLDQDTEGGISGSILGS